MSTPIIFRDVDFHQYTIDPDCTIYKNNEIVPIEDIIYHSTNGYDYVLLETLSGELKLYRLEFVMVSSFNPGIQNKWEHFKVNHIDGDIKNCHIDNLTFEEDVEEWRIVEYPETVKRNTYAISSWGRVKNIVRDRYRSTTRTASGYIIISFKSTSNLYLHRIVAHHFITNTNPREYKVINHIDGDRSNNHVTNLEWCSYYMNESHMIFCNNNVPRTTKLTKQEIELVVSILSNTECNGSPSIAFSMIDHTRHPHITIPVISAIKKRHTAYTTIVNYDDIKFNRCTNNMTISDIDMVIELLLEPKYNGSPKRVFDAIDHNRYPYITKQIINEIKYKQPPYIRPGGKYNLCNITFPKTILQTEDIDMVIELLLQHHGSPTQAYKHIDHDRYPYISRGIIGHIKLKLPRYIRPDSKYDLRNIIF